MPELKELDHTISLSDQMQSGEQGHVVLINVFHIAAEEEDALIEAWSRDGLLELIPNPDHKNSPLVEHSRETQLAFRRVSRLQVVWADRLADGWSVNDLTTVIQMLRLLRTSIDDDKEQRTSLK